MLKLKWADQCFEACDTGFAIKFRIERDTGVDLWQYAGFVFVETNVHKGTAHATALFYGVSVILKVRLDHCYKPESINRTFDTMAALSVIAGRIEKRVNKLESL